MFHSCSSRMLLMLSCLPIVAGCGGSSPPPPAEPAPSRNVVWFCRESRRFVLAPDQTVPGVHPVTLRMTLDRALYCDQCRRWHPTPPPDRFRGDPRSYRCPQHQTPMRPDGPLEGVENPKGEP